MCADTRKWQSLSFTLYPFISISLLASSRNSFFLCKHIHARDTRVVANRYNSGLIWGPRSDWSQRITVWKSVTRRCSAVAVRPRDAPCRWKFCCVTQDDAKLYRWVRVGSYYYSIVTRLYLVTFLWYSTSNDGALLKSGLGSFKVIESIASFDISYSGSY